MLLFEKRYALFYLKTFFLTINRTDERVFNMHMKNKNFVVLHSVYRLVLFLEELRFQQSSVGWHIFRSPPLYCVTLVFCFRMRYLRKSYLS